MERSGALGEGRARLSSLLPDASPQLLSVSLPFVELGGRRGALGERLAADSLLLRVIGGMA